MRNLEDGGSGAYRCDAAREAVAGSLSVGYDWRLDATASMGVRLTAEAAHFADKAGIGLPSFRHRALLFTVQLNLR